MLLWGKVKQKFDPRVGPVFGVCALLSSPTRSYARTQPRYSNVAMRQSGLVHDKPD